MRLLGLNILSLGSFLVLMGILVAAEVKDRTEKHFSLFSVVTFKNEECTSETTLTGGARTGTCYTTTECSDKSGMKSGNCASGFGVCCVFIDTGAATKTISENRTWLRNAEYPSYATATTAQAIIYTVSKMQSDICQIRLDFTMFQIAGPGNTNEQIAGTTTYTHCTRDNLIITSTERSTQSIADPGTICGSITGEHLYFDVTRTTTDKLTVTLNTVATGTTGSATITPALANRIWDFQVNQIPCYATYRAPEGCHRYYTTESGKITSLNFQRVTTTPSTTAPIPQNTGLELGGQRLNTCIRRSKGMCCTQYQLCSRYDGIALTDEAMIGADGDGMNDATWNEAWSIDLDTSPFLESIIDAPGFMSDGGMIDAGCTGDYVEIPSSYHGSCGASFGPRAFISTRYCGSKFGVGIGGNAGADLLHSTQICDCSEPFRVTHMTDLGADNGGQDDVNVILDANLDGMPRGFCLDYRQTPCYS
jgi:hypothetical protein